MAPTRHGGLRLGRVRHTSERLIGDLAWAGALRASRDVTDAVGDSRLMVLAPHPDDETLACGGSIARVAARGGPLRVVVATDGRHARHDVLPDSMAEVREAELEAAAAALGAGPADICRLGFEDGTLGEREAELTARIDSELRTFRPTVVMAPWAHDVHPDHAALGRVARAAVTPDGTVMLLEYVVWAWTEPFRMVRRTVLPTRNGDSTTRPSGGGWGETIRPVRVMVADHRSAKLVALGSHRSQLAPSAADVGLPSGDGPLEGTFLDRFVGSSELFFVVRPPVAPR